MGLALARGLARSGLVAFGWPTLPPIGRALPQLGRHESAALRMYVFAPRPMNSLRAPGLESLTESVRPAPR